MFKQTQQTQRHSKKMFYYCTTEKLFNVVVKCLLKSEIMNKCKWDLNVLKLTEMLFQMSFQCRAATCSELSSNTAKSCWHQGTE